jgi:hypothetical protein
VQQICAWQLKTMTWMMRENESWKNFGLITTLIVCTLCWAAIHRQKCAAKPLSVALTSTNSSGNLIAAGYTSCQ